VVGLAVVIVRRRRAKAAADPASGAPAAAFQPDGRANPPSPAQARTGPTPPQPSGPSGPYGPQGTWAPPPAGYQPNPTAQYR
jgi:hypothetical protein